MSPLWWLPLSLSLSFSCRTFSQHNGDILGRLVLDDGSVLRASTNALPTLDCLFRDPQQDGGGLLQVWALNALPGKASESATKLRHGYGIARRLGGT